MSIPIAPTLELVGATETAIKVQFLPISTGGFHHILEWKEYPQSWNGQVPSKTVIAADSTTATLTQKCLAEAENLQPGSTYCVRLVLQSTDGQRGPPGPELVVDTEQVGCTPKPGSEKGSCCIIL